MVDKEMLMAMEELLDRKLEPLNECTFRLETSVKKLEADVKEIKVDKLENNVIPRLSTIEGCYLDTYRRYVQNNELIEKMAIEVNALVKTVQNHSVLLHAT